MNFLSLLIDSIIDYVRRNPLTTIIIIMLMVFAPSVFGVLFIGVIIGLAVLLAVPIFMLFRLRRLSRNMERDANRSQQQARSQQQYYRNNTTRNSEGEVKVYTTSQQPQKRVNDNVGDYVDFEEVKTDKK
ncbi:MAG: DUF4834 family protein [Alistipes sp.]|nr:DUF4834 family protein [Alistipes sp.]